MSEAAKAATIWLQQDSRDLYRAANTFRERGRPVDRMIAIKVQESAAHSSRLARMEMGVEA